MSWWPAESSSVNTKDNSTGSLKTPPCRVYAMGNGSKWSQNSGPKYPNSTWDEWYNHNIKVTKELSILMNTTIEEVSELLYSLTLQNFNNILNPKCRGWNCRCVPLSRIDTCDRYLSVFDLNGNLRDPRNPRSLMLLLEFMQSVILGDAKMDMSISTSPSAKSGAPANAKYKELYPSYDSKIYFMYDKRLGRLLDPDVDKIVAIKERIFTDHDKIISSRSIQMPRNYISPNSHARPTNFELGHIASYPLNLKRSDDNLLDKKGRRRGKGSYQLMDLRTNRAEFLRRLLQHINKADPEDFLRSLASVDLKNPRSKYRRNKKAAAELANFYENIVTNQSEPKKLKKEKDLKQNSAEVLAPIEKTVEFGRERKYYAEQIPVLFHAPYQSTNRSTWLRRSPDQLRMQEDGRLGGANVGRYKRESVKMSLLKAQLRYSIHSLNSVVAADSSRPVNIKAKETDLIAKSEYKRIFPSASRRFRQSKHAKGH